MRFMTWNIQNGGGTRVDEICRRIGESDPDVLALTEFRNTNEPVLRHRLAGLGYSHIATSKPEDRQNGLLVASKHSLRETGERIDYDGERWLPLRITDADIDVLTVHIPGAPDNKFAADGYGISGAARKERFWQQVLGYARDHRDRPAVLIGDFNTGLRADAEGAMFKMSHYLQALIDIGFIDTWRCLHPRAREYSWYSKRKDKQTAETQDHNGFRLDYVFVSPVLAASLESAAILHGPRWDSISDHAPVVVDLKR